MGHLESVDNALRLLLLMARGRQVSVTEVAGELGVAPSTAHRLLTTLRYRGFVVQSGDRTYGPGPAMALMGGRPKTGTSLLSITQPHLEKIVSAVNETCHLVVLIHRECRFLASAEAPQTLRVSTRVGQVMPAHLTSGGKCLLADLSADSIEALYPLRAGVPELNLSVGDVARLRRELATARHRGYAVNRGQSERGLFAIGVPVRTPEGRAIAGLSISLPTVRYSARRLPQLFDTLQATASAMTAELAADAFADG